jgi:hypothetical protein
MTYKSSYRTARIAAATLHSHFTTHLSNARQQGQQSLASEPDPQAIEALIDIAFWASLRREEGHSPRISLAYLEPQQANRPLLFEKPLELTPSTLTKLGPAVERPGIHLGVWTDHDRPYIWGATRAVPSFCFILETVEPGLLVIKHRRVGGFGKFANVAVLRGEQIKLVDERGGDVPDCPSLIVSLLGLNSPSSTDDPSNLLIQLSASMRQHGRGGSLLVVPNNSQAWRNSIVQPIQYSIRPAFSGLADLIHQDDKVKSESRWQEALGRAIDGIAGLTAVDGATVISDSYEVLAFGVKIGRPEGRAPVQQIMATEPVIDNKAVVIHPAQNGGTRHLSAAQFIHDQQDALALVASQDGRFTIFAWSACEQMVHAHRIDALLL